MTEMDDDYGKELKIIMNEISPFTNHVSIGGKGPGRFLFAKHGGKSIELSHLDSGEIWVEFWTSASEWAVMDGTYLKYTDAIVEIMKWFNEEGIDGF